MSDAKPVTAIPPNHQALLEAVATILREMPSAAASLAAWVAGEAGDMDEPKPGEYPKFVNGRTCANRREERKSIALGPAAAQLPPPPSDWDKAAAGIDQRAKVQRDRRLVFAEGRIPRQISQAEYEELKRAGRIK
jgi:hypothetical protein